MSKEKIWGSLDKVFGNINEVFESKKRGFEIKEYCGKLERVTVNGKEKKITKKVRKAYEEMKETERQYLRARDRFYASL